jgi:hypothetical protein
VGFQGRIDRARRFDSNLIVDRGQVSLRVGATDNGASIVDVEAVLNGDVGVRHSNKFSRKLLVIGKWVRKTTSTAPLAYIYSNGNSRNTEPSHHQSGLIHCSNLLFIQTFLLFKLCIVQDK